MSQNCIVSIHLYNASSSAHQSEALPVRETQREESREEIQNINVSYIWLKHFLLIGLESRSSRHVGTFCKSFTCSCCSASAFKLRHSVNCCGGCASVRNAIEIDKYNTIQYLTLRFII